ncbi:hypothetical protein TVAG_101080 [Trichomonas vaginalis G3]|uniref:DUF3447 domain-containing protein n=1 Tax=Trichomonas vaginalis (strain ATCC PRA-98 / G3) TaxID=412133 RepID=A2DJJ0_TRIV3|nr:spectrin binding [Trichomonas vaginalis G3]EAY19390.1 hypothetical protein TVAG_101080 [Trichomonas vaginalis G3]KAI5493216.1 spectrin binding [Trichomonas vaginalis G3]|eukprot:XP_001580376.1 hypothetical protein [Trichomonas vaginalis G3]
MSGQVTDQKKYSELRDTYKSYIDPYIALYQLKADNDEELTSIYKTLKTNLIDSKKRHAQDVIRDIFNIIPYNNRYTKSYLRLAKFFVDEYQIKVVTYIPDISRYLFHKEYGTYLCESTDFKFEKIENLDIHSENTIYRAIMYNDLEKIITFTEQEDFNEIQELFNVLYPSNGQSLEFYTLLELCCYHGSVDCFKLLLTKFHSEITESVLNYHF